MLTDTAIKRHIREGKAHYVSAGNNPHLRIRSTGAAWVFRYKIPANAEWATADDLVVVNAETGKVTGQPFNPETDKHVGKSVELGLGSYPEVGLSAAGDAARKLFKIFKNGGNPRAEHNPQRVTPEKAKTFEEYGVEFVDAHKGQWRNPKHRQQYGNTLRDYAYPLIGKKAPSEIGVKDVHAVLLPLWATKTETASRLRQRIETVLDYAFVLEGIDRRNPARWKGNLDKLLPNARKTAKAAGKLKPHAAPPWQELPGIMTKLREKETVVSALALRFSFLTAARSTEVRELPWTEIDTDNAKWTLPGDRAKNEEEHYVPLNEEALEVLALAKALNPESERVFPGAKGGIISDVALNKVLHAAYPGITAHGTARSCFRDWVADATGFSDKIAEAALNHLNPNETELSYLRTKFYDRRIPLMKAWGEYLKGKDNVISLASKSVA